MSQLSRYTLLERLGSSVLGSLYKAQDTTTGSVVALRVVQPLRVAHGGLNLLLPVSYDYGDGAVGYQASVFNLAPTGREVDVEAAYSIGLLGGLHHQYVRTT